MKITKQKLILPKYRSFSSSTNMGSAHWRECFVVHSISSHRRPQRSSPARQRYFTREQYSSRRAWRRLKSLFAPAHVVVADGGGSSDDCLLIAQQKEASRVTRVVIGLISERSRAPISHTTRYGHYHRHYHHTPPHLGLEAAYRRTRALAARKSHA